MPCLFLLLAGIVFGASSHFIVERCRKDYKNINQLRSIAFCHTRGRTYKGGNNC